MAEWVHLFEKLNKNVSAQDARLIFMQIDKNGSGSVSLSELIPIVFSKATRA
jgi:Ca2+-binding EF-hand superfamily protein